MIPAVLVALLTSPTQALLVAGVYLLVQIIESNLDTIKVITIPKIITKVKIKTL